MSDRKQAEKALARQARAMTALYETSLEIISQLDLSTLLRAIVRRAVGLLGARMGGLYLVMPDGKTLELVVNHNLPGDYAGTRLHLGEGLSGRVAQTGKPMTVGDYRQWERAAAAYADEPFRRMLSVPLKVGDRVIGVINVADDERTDAFDEDEIRLVSLFADQAAIAVENSRLFQAEREQRQLAEALEEAAAVISSTLDYEQVLDRILEQVERVVAGDTFNIMLISEGQGRVVRWRGYDRLGVPLPPTVGLLPITRFPNLARMAQTGQPLIIPDTSVNPDWILLEGREWLRSYVGAPIRVGDTTVGFLNVNGTRPGQFSPADARRLKAFANHAAIAIENARLYQQLRDHAELLERRVQERTAQIQAHYARLDAILRSTADGIIVTDADGEIVQINPIAHTWLTQTLSLDDVARLLERVQDLARRAEERPEVVLELTGLDLELKAAPISQPGVEEAAAVIAVHDVSYLKALDRMKSRLVSNVSHELRTPVTTIKLYAHLMQRNPEKWRQYLDVLIQEADRQAQLVESVLQISRIDAGRMEIEPRPICLNELTEATVTGHQALARDGGLTLEHRPARPGPVALVDPTRVMQVLNNLVGNAIRYTPEGGTVVVSTGRGEAKGRGWATVTVMDTGIGIPEDELPFIFDRFFRGREPRARQLAGTGLGLSIVKEIVELHGGEVTVESQVGVGSTFTVWLPLADW